MEGKCSYYATIPANVRYDKSLSANAKLLYGEITALCNYKGYCWSTNKYFSDLYGVSQSSISRWISLLVSKKYLFVEMVYQEGTKEILERRLSIIKDPIEENTGTPVEENDNTPIRKNAQENTTGLNTTVINKSVSQSKEKEKTDELTDETINALKRQIDYDYFEDNYPEDLSGVDVLIGCIAKMLIAPSTKISGCVLPRSVLKSYIARADSTIVREFLVHMRGQKMRDVKNISAYWQSAFINFIKEEELVRLTV